MDSPTLEFGHVQQSKKGFQSKIKKRLANSVDPDGLLQAISSGSTLFAQLFVFVSRAEKVKPSMQFDQEILFSYNVCFLQRLHPL